MDWHTIWSTRARSVRHVIANASGSTTVLVDQSVNGGKWNLLTTLT